jgi:hypothetical protein
MFEEPSLKASHNEDDVVAGYGCTEQDVFSATSVGSGDETKYTCQATQLPRFTMPLAWYDVRQYLADYRSGNVSLRHMLVSFIYVSYFYASLAYRGTLGRPVRSLYDGFQSFGEDVPFPRRHGSIPAGQITPTATLNLQPGELVRVKSYGEILATLHGSNMNRGMLFDAELVPFCGGVYRVKTRVNRFINEKTGMMWTLQTPAIMLEGVWCQSRYSYCSMFCPRSIYSWWREIWLERVAEKKRSIIIENSSPPMWRQIVRRLTRRY